MLEISPVEQRVEEMLRGFGLPAFSWPFRTAWTAAGDKTFAPPSDVIVTDQLFTVRTDLPGIDPARDVTVVMEDGDLVIRGERKQHTETKDKGYYRSEVFTGYFERRFAVPKTHDEAKIAATYQDGVLEVTVPLTAAAGKPKAIKIATPTKNGK
jgi:HSP20 family protein